MNPTGVYTRLFDWWLDAYAPNTQSPAGGASPGFGGLSLNSFAANNSDATGFFDPNDWRNYRSMDATLPPDITGGVKATENDTLTAYFVWTGPDPVPDHADFLIKTSVSATASVDYGQSPASSGLSATAAATLGSDKADATASFPGDNQTQIKPGSHLVRVKPSGKVATVSLSGGAMTSASNSLPDGVWTSWFGSHMDYLADPAGGHGNGPTRANASASAHPDSRDLTLSSSIEDSYYKGAPDLVHGQSDRWLHQRNSDGSMSVDAAATYSVADRNRQWIGTATFTANTSNFQSPQYAWSGNFNPVGSSPNMNQQSVYGEFLLGSANSLPSPTTVTVNVTGPDSTGGNVATVSNTYTVNWHLPREKNTYLGATKTKHKVRTLAAHVYPGPGTIKSLDPGGEIPYSAILDGVSAILDVAGHPEAAGTLDMLSKITEIPKWSYTYGGDNNQSLVIDDANEWQLGNSDNNETAYTGPSNIPKNLLNYPNGQDLCYLDWAIVEKDTDASWYAYGYDGHGYDGVSTHPVNVHKVDLIEGQPFFTQYKNPDGSPYTG